MGEGKYYWLKLKRDFFKRHDVRVLETRCGGDKLVLVYLKMLCESVDHDGYLRFSPSVPYNADTLSAVLNENEDTLELALDIYEDFGLIEIQEDGTIFLPKVKDMIGSASNTESANRQRRYRERLKNKGCDEDVTGSVTKCNGGVTESVTKHNESKSKSKNKNKSIDNNIYVQEFEELWKLYPRKEGKENAKKSYIKARKEGVTKEEVEQGILNYGAYIKANNVDGKYIKMGSTWFNQRCWTDEHSIRVKSGRNDWIDEVEL